MFTGPKIVTGGLTLYLDGGNAKSSGHSHENWVDLIRTPVTPNSEVVNIDGGLDTWYVKRSTITVITDGSIVPPIEGATVWSSTINTASYANTLHRNWSQGNDNGVIGDLGEGYYRYFMWVRGNDSNSANATFSIDISDGKSSGNIAFTSDDGWKLLSVWDNSAGSYNSTKFFDYELGGDNGDTFYISGITIARYNTSDSSSLTPLYSFPGHIPYYSTGSVNIQGVPTNGTSFSTDKFVFDGTNDHITLFDSTNLWSGDFSIETVLQSDVTANQFIFSNGTYGSAATNFWLGGGGDDNFNIHLRKTDGSGATGYNYNLNSPYTNKTHLCVTFDSSSRDLSVYQDGDLVETKTASSLVDPSWMDNGWRLGNTGGSYNFNGDMYMFKTYNTVLTSTEVYQNYNATKERFNL